MKDMVNGMEEKITDIKNLFQAADTEKLPELISVYENDARSGVRNLILTARKRLDALEKEKARTESLKKFEYEYEQISKFENFKKLI